MKTVGKKIDILILILAVVWWFATVFGDYIPSDKHMSMLLSFVMIMSVSHILFDKHPKS